MTNDRERAERIATGLDVYARDYDNYEYGLPIYIQESRAAMFAIIEAELAEVRRETVEECAPKQVFVEQLCGQYASKIQNERSDGESLAQEYRAILETLHEFVRALLPVATREETT